jgi:hypothetical protein
MGDEVKHVQLRLDVDAYDILKSEATIAGLTPASLLKKNRIGYYSNQEHR